MKINFLIADEIRSETNGKHTVLGLYPDNIIVLENKDNSGTNTNSPNLTAVIDRLAIFVNISEISEGEHEIKGQVIDPSGNPLGAEIPFGNTSIETGKSHTYILETRQFIVKERGTYQFKLIVDGIAYEYPFKIIDRTTV